MALWRVVCTNRECTSRGARCARSARGWLAPVSLRMLLTEPSGALRVDRVEVPVFVVGTRCGLPNDGQSLPGILQPPADIAANLHIRILKSGAMLKCLVRVHFAKWGYAESLRVTI